MNEWLRKLLFLPPQSSTVAKEIDTLHYFVITVTMLGVAAVTVMGGYYLVRYRSEFAKHQERRGRLVRRIPMWTEAGLTAGVLGIFVLWWYIGFQQFIRIRVSPPATVDVYVVAKKWMWIFAYPDGRASIARLYVPANRPIRLLLGSRDVIHSFYVPDFRIKQDAVPGRLTTIWFEAKRPGTHEILCTEYCGAGHSTMRGEVVALSPDEYSRWLKRGAEDFQRPAPPLAYAPPAFPGERIDEGQPVTLVEQGRSAASRYGCVRCHTLDGSPHIGPTWLGLYESRVPLERGGSIVADEAYITRSIMDPLAHVHRGFATVMPSYLGQIAPAEVAAIVEFIRSLASPDPGEIFKVPLAGGGLEARVTVPGALGEDETSKPERELRQRVGGREDSR